MRGLGLRPDIRLSPVRGGEAVAPVPFSPTTLFGGTQGAFYDPSDVSSMYQTTDTSTPAAVDSPVGRINDKSGNNNHALQATAGFRPILRQSGTLYWLEFDGIDDRLQALFTIAQPFDRVSALRNITALTTTARVFTGVGILAGALYQNAATLVVRDGTNGPTQPLPAAGVDYIPTERHANTLSRLALDNGAYSTTPASGAAVPGGITIGLGEAGTFPSNIRFYGMSMIARDLTDPETASLRTFMAAKQGRVL